MKNSIEITGMTCASCAQNISRSLTNLHGVSKADINFVTHKAEIDFDSSMVSEARIKEVIASLGYGVVENADVLETLESEKREESREKKFVIWAIVLVLPFIVRMFWEWEVPGSFLGVSSTHWAEHNLAFILVFFFGWRFHRGAWYQIRTGQFDMDSLVSMGTLSAYFFSVYVMVKHSLNPMMEGGPHLYFESAASIVALILLGKYLELKSRGRASEAMRKLLELGVKKARVLIDGVETEIDIEEVKIGDRIVVRPSEKIALDGVVVSGESNVNESMLTGESMPVVKSAGAKVFGSTINENGRLEIEVTAVGANTVLAQIIRTVEEAQTFKAPMQKLADKISGVFVPVVIVIALLTFAGWYVAKGDLSIALINAVSVLIIACPCALGIATPMAVMVGTSVGARRGILIKSGESFQLARDIDVVVFDKTGTLTKGEAKVARLIANDKYNDEKLLTIAGSLAAGSEHPLSKAVYRYANEQNVRLISLKGFAERAGRGVIGASQADEANLVLGNIKLLEENDVDVTWPEKVLNENKASGATIIFATHNKEVIGAIEIADEIKDTAVETIVALKKAGILPMMLSGDNKHTAATVARRLGIEKYLAEVLPADKQNEIKKLQREGKRVVFVGDGINDAPSLVQADLGIAMGSGTDIAKETGNIIIMKNEPIKVVEAIILSQKTFRIIKENLFWAFFYNVLAIPLAIAGLVNPMIGALAMGLSDVFVIGNSLRIYRK